MPNRPPNKRELKNLPTDCPSVSGEGAYKNTFSADAIMNRRKGKKRNIFYANIKRWVFYLS